MENNNARYNQNDEKADEMNELGVSRLASDSLREPKPNVVKLIQINSFPWP